MSGQRHHSSVSSKRGNAAEDLPSALFLPSWGCSPKPQRNILVFSKEKYICILYCPFPALVSPVMGNFPSHGSLQLYGHPTMMQLLHIILGFFCTSSYLLCLTFLLLASVFWALILHYWTEYVNRGLWSAQRELKSNLRSRLKANIQTRTRLSGGGIGVQGSLLAFGFNSLLKMVYEIWSLFRQYILCIYTSSTALSGFAWLH